MRIARIRLSDKTSRLRPRRAAPTLGQTYEPEVPVEVREWIRPASASPDLVFGPQPPALANVNAVRYMPREVVEALKKEGRWREGEDVAKP